MPIIIYGAAGAVALQVTKHRIFPFMHVTATPCCCILNPVFRIPSRCEIRYLSGWTATMLFVLTAWVFFRSSDGGTEQAMLILKQMFTFGNGVSWLYSFAAFAIPFMMITHIWNKLKGTELRTHLPADRWHTAVITFALLWLLIIFPSNGFQPFIYFQF